MNEVIQTMIRRRSVRRYLPQQIDDVSLDRILTAGLYAANGGNLQHPRFIVVQDPDILSLLARTAQEEFASQELKEGQYKNKSIRAAKASKEYNFLFHAPTLIIVVSDRSWLNSMADSAGSLQNMQLAACSLGLGACWVNQLHWLTDVASIRAIVEGLGMLPEEDIYGSMVVGLPADPLPPPPPRKEGRVILHR